MNGPKQGANNAMQFLGKQKGKCPNQKLVLIGYSEGAMVVVQLLQKQGFPTNQVSSIILYGNPYWLAGKAWNAGTAVSGVTVVKSRVTRTRLTLWIFWQKTGKGVAALTGIKMPASFGPKTQDICISGDIICTGSGGMGPHL